MAAKAGAVQRSGAGATASGMGFVRSVERSMRQPGAGSGEPGATCQKRRVCGEASGTSNRRGEALGRHVQEAVYHSGAGSPGPCERGSGAGCGNAACSETDGFPNSESVQPRPSGRRTRSAAPRASATCAESLSQGLPATSAVTSSVTSGVCPSTRRARSKSPECATAGSGSPQRATAAGRHQRMLRIESVLALRACVICGSSEARGRTGSTLFQGCCPSHRR